MAYRLKEVTIRTDNSVDGMNKINELWEDIQSGKIPLLFDSSHKFLEGISPVSKYSNYENYEKGNYDLTVMGVGNYFFKELEIAVRRGLYKKYVAKDDNGNISACTRKAWEEVYADQKNGEIKRKFTEDYESTVPKEYTKDGKAHCYLYIAIE